MLRGSHGSHLGEVRGTLVSQSETTTRSGPKPTKEGPGLNQPKSVLIVDRSEETREVLATVLGRRGVRTLSAAGGPQGLRLARQHHPDLIVLDLEVVEGAVESGGLSAEFAHQSRVDRAPLVLLGTARRSHPPLSEGEFVSKPYHYAPLIRKIEELLSRREAPRAEVA